MMAPASILYPLAQGLLYYVRAAYTDDLLSELVREAESLIPPNDLYLKKLNPWLLHQEF